MNKPIITFFTKFIDHPLVVLGLFLALVFMPAIDLKAQLKNLEWTEREDLTILLPSSIKIYEHHGILEDGEPIKAVYSIIDLRDNNLKLRVVGSNVERESTKESYEKNDGIVAINGGYFSNNSSVSLLISDGEIIASGPSQGISRGAFGLVNKKPEIVWPYVTDEGVFIYDHPASPHRHTEENNAARWLANQAVGGGPILIKSGKISVSSKEEGFGGSHLARHPRSAIGYIDENTLIMIVVDGRQEASVGVTLDELAEIMLDIGCIEALNLDGGGSSTMVAADEIINIPSDMPNGDRNSLRNNASAIVISEIQTSIDKESKIIDTDSPHYKETGLWKDDNQANFYGSTSSRISSADYPYNTATYTFEDIKSQKYQLAAWWTVHSSLNTDSSLYILHYGENIDSIYINQSSLKNSGKWNILGEYQLGSGDYLELTGTGKKGKIVADAVRLVALEKSPLLPIRGDVRIALMSDLNSGLGAVNYEWQVDSIVSRIPRIWKPDLVICGGDMVAGMGISDTIILTNMWAGFEKHIAKPFKEANIPFAFTLGNHDGPRSYPMERKATQNYWLNPQNSTGLKFIDRTNFPDYYSFINNDVFIVSWDAASPSITENNLLWLEEQFKLEEAKNAKLRLVMGHMPLYSVAQERDSKGNVLENPEKLRALLEKYNVHTYISGHQHAYYPGKRGQLELLNTGAAGSGPRGWLDMDYAPVNTITIMDIFFDPDTITYTTYNIAEKDADKMEILDEKTLPTAFFGINGHIIRRDLKLPSEVEGNFYNYPSVTNSGHVNIKIKNNDYLITGTLDEKFKNPHQMGLYKGRNSESGELILKVKPIFNKNGTFTATFKASEDLQEWMAAGATFLKVNDNIRAQLYAPSNQAPSESVIISHNNRNVYAVRNIDALYDVGWIKAVDPEGDFITYKYQLAKDIKFQNILLDTSTERRTGFKMTEKEWFALLGDAPEGTQVDLFHRILAFDGKNHSFSTAEKLMLMKSPEPLDDYIEVPAPELNFAGKIENASGAGYGAVWDGEDKLWLIDYNGKIIIKNNDGTDASFSPLSTLDIAGQDYTLKPINGIGVDTDGNILISRNRHLIKIDASTGEGIAVWEVPEGNRAITSPRVNGKGEIYVMSLFAEDGNFVLRQSATDPTNFDLIRTIQLPDRILARTFDMSPDGLTIYFPSPGSAFIQKYTSIDGINYLKDENITSIVAGSNALRVDDHGKIYTAVRANGVRPSTFHFRDDRKKIMWTHELPEVAGAEARGIGISPDGNTLIFCSYDKGGGFYKYVFK